MTKTIVKFRNYELSFTDDDIIDHDDAPFAHEYNPHNHSAWLFHDHGFTLCVVFASCLQEALDEAADNGKLDRYQFSYKDYDGSDELAHLGNASEPFDIESLGYVNFPLPTKSITKSYGPSIDAKEGHLA